MILTPRFIEFVNEAIQAVDRDIEARRESGSDFVDLTAIRKELTEVLGGKRDDFSPGLVHMMVDSMSWEQPCRKALRPVSDALLQLSRRRNRSPT